jgi:multiple sugar transport system permease protein
MLGKKWTGYWFVLRGAITLAVILGFPAVTAILESVGLVGRKGGVSLANCTRLLGDVQFPVTTWSTLIFVVAVVSFHLVMGPRRRAAAQPRRARPLGVPCARHPACHLPPL